MYRLVCNAQKYDWGRKGHQSKVALYKQAQDSEFQINENESYAELWMGTHKNCPSKLEQNETLILLSDYLKSNLAKSLGENVLKRFYTTSNEDEKLGEGDLPFLFKVLSINKALSIQAHPNKTHAKQLHLRDPKNYPDPNHKPEMLVAISEEFEAMCGFRLAEEIRQHFSSLPELVSLCDKENVDEFLNSSSESILRKCFTSMMNKNQDFVSEQFNKLKLRLSTKPETERSYLDNLYLRLAEQYVNDVGCFSIFLLNCLKLKQGEAIFLSANIPHAYLFGDGVECMACSDNVVRAGLTPKFKDVNVLCDMLDYRMRSSDDNKLMSVRTSLSSNLDYLIEFRPSVDEFSVQQIKIEQKHLSQGQKSFLIPKSDTGSILIVIEMNSSASYFSFNDKKFNANLGLVYYIDALTDVYFNLESGSNNNQNSTILLAFRAYTDIKSN